MPEEFGSAHAATAEPTGDTTQQSGRNTDSQNGVTPTAERSVGQDTDGADPAILRWYRTWAGEPGS